MAEVQHSQIRAQLLQKVVPLVDKSDLATKSGKDLESHLLSRAVAVASLSILADIDLASAAKAIVDGGDDNGIDSIYYDPQERCLFLVQSKWSASHSSSVDSGDILKFLQGVQDLVSLKRERFNAKIAARWTSIEDALSQLHSVRIIIAYPGSAKIDPKIQDKINDFVASQNDTSELFFLVTVTQRELFHFFVSQAAAPQINIDIRLKHYGVVESPLKAVYGQVSAIDVASWFQKFGTHLFARNIRNYLGSSEVNDAISSTLKTEPDNFWFYNNGLTIIAEELRKQAVGGNDRSVGQFSCKNVTIVNGAQTVGSIGRTEIAGENPAFLQARIIEVTDPESSLSRQITKASNTQNKIDARNFVALDPQQERLRTELLIEKISYEYREGEPLTSPLTGFDFIEAITTLACASQEISYVALAKGIGGLYLDIETAPYKALINGSTSALKLWTLVKLARRN